LTDQWDRFASGAERTIDALGYQANVAVFQPTESFIQGETGEGFRATHYGQDAMTLDPTDTLVDAHEDSRDIILNG